MKDKKVEAQKEIVSIPAMKYFQSMYGRSFEGNDQKAADSFQMFESKERLSTLRLELQWVKDEKVAARICDMVIGKKRLSRYESYSNWAWLMLKWLAIKKG